MLKLDNNLLDELGLSALPDDQKKAMLQHIYETLELRVGTQLANQMTDQQLEEFEQFIDEGGEGNQAQALQWLETNLPNYKQVVNQVFEALKGEVKQMAPQIVATSVPQSPPAMSETGQPVGQPIEAGYAPPPSAAPTGQQPASPNAYQPAPQGFSTQPYLAGDQTSSPSAQSFGSQPQPPQSPPGQAA